jgi:hypothetical protein
MAVNARGIYQKLDWHLRQQDLSGLPDRLLRGLGGRLANRQLERDFEILMRTSAKAYLARQTAENAPKVVFATFGSGNWHLVLEMLLAHALSLRGASPELLLCDLPTLPVCDERTVLARDVDLCFGCLAPKQKLLQASKLPWRGMTAFLTSDSLTKAKTIVADLKDEQLEDYKHGQWPIGRWVHVSGCHFLRCDARGNNPEKVSVRRRFLTSAIVVTEAVERWLDEVQPDILIAESGAHFMWRIAFELARARGIRVVCREIGKGGLDSHIYSLNSLSMFHNWSDIWTEARQEDLSPVENERLDAYLGSLVEKTYDNKTNDLPMPDAEGISEEFGLDPNRKTAVLFTNVTWDLTTAGRDVGFDGLLDWILETISLIENLPDAQLVIRAHPAENHVLTREHILDRIHERYPNLPQNVYLIPPEKQMAARGLYELASLVLAYCSTTGIEAAIYRKPVLLGGDPHYRGKGFTIDLQSRQEYADLLQQWAAGGLDWPSQEASELAKRYFHLFFLRYHIPMGWTTSPLEPPFKLKLKDLAELLPNRNVSLDVVCSGILNGHEIILPRELRVA